MILGEKVAFRLPNIKENYYMLGSEIAANSIPTEEILIIGDTGSADNRLNELYWYLVFSKDQFLKQTGKLLVPALPPMENRIDAMLSTDKLMQYVYKLCESVPLTAGKFKRFPL